MGWTHIQQNRCFFLVLFDGVDGLDYIVTDSIICVEVELYPYSSLEIILNCQSENLVKTISVSKTSMKVSSNALPDFYILKVLLVRDYEFEKTIYSRFILTL